MSLTIGPPNQSGLDLVLGEIGKGAATGLQDQLGRFHNEKKLTGLLPLLEKSGLNLDENQKRAFVKSGLDPEKVVQISAALGKQQEAKKEKEEKIAEEKQKLQDTFSRMVELARSPNIGIRTTPQQFLGGKAQEEQSEFTSLKAELVGALREMVNRGALTNQKFKYITEKLLPEHNDRQAKIRGKLKGIAQVLGVDPEEVGLSLDFKEGSKGQTERLSLEEIFK